MRALGCIGEGVVGEDGGLELVHNPDLLNKIDMHTGKNMKSLSAKKIAGSKSERDYKTV